MSTEWHVSLTLPPVLANATTELCELRPTIPSLFPVINAFEIIQGIKLNSIFAPENDSCFIPQVCQVCQSANGDSRIVGVEVVSFLSSAEKQPTQPFPFKQVMPRFFPFFSMSTLKMRGNLRAIQNHHGNHSAAMKCLSHEKICRVEKIHKLQGFKNRGNPIQTSLFDELPPV